MEHTYKDNFNIKYNLDNLSKKCFNIKKIVICIIFILINIILLLISNNDRIYYNNKIKLGITGDSYASYLYNCLNGNINCPVEPYFVAGQTVIENKNIMIKAMNSNCKYVFISIGVNDHFKNTNLQIFHDTLENIIEEGLKHKKIIFMHSFIQYPVSSKFISKYSTHDYDNIIKSLSEKHEKVHYIDINSYYDEKYFENDSLHLNKTFYDIFYGIILKEFDKNNIN